MSCSVNVATSRPVPMTERPLAASGLTSYRCKNAYGWTMIGAKDAADAMREARRTSPESKVEDLEIWNGSTYVPVAPVTAPLLSNLVATTEARAGRPTNRATGGKTLKYVRTVHGFTVFPTMAAVHRDLSLGLAGRPISAGFVEWDADGRPLCMGESESLGIKSRDDDTDALRADWGMR